MNDRSTGPAPGAGPSRRVVLQGLLAGAGAAVVAPSALSVRAAFAADGAAVHGRDVLVVLSLRNGFDGLSAVAPVGDPHYATARPKIGVPAGEGLALDRTFALHPALAPLLPLWQAGHLGAVHAVGQPDGSRSHFRCQEELERAAPGTTLRTGWLDRAISGRPTGSALQAVQLGTGTVDQHLLGPAPELAVPGLSGLGLRGTGWLGPEWGATIARLHEGVAGPAADAARAALAVVDSAARVGEAAVPTTKDGGPYPDTPLGAALRDTAALVRADLGAEVVCIDEGDWDMHERLGSVTEGWMTRNLGRLAAALAAFGADLGPDMARVTLVTLTEFGRRVDENGSGGLDHGYGSLVLLLGGGVNGGQVHGRWPGLAPEALDAGGLAGTTDYRDVLAEVLLQRCGQSSVADVFPGFRPTPLGLVRPGSAAVAPLVPQQRTRRRRAQFFRAPV